MYKPICILFIFLDQVKIWRVVVFTAILFVYPVADARAAYITFDDYAAGTQITDQYLGQGVVFSGGSSPPPVIQRFSDGSGALTSYYSGGFIIATFVDPSDSSPVEVTNLKFSWSMIWWNATPSTFTYYDINGEIIREDIIASWLGDPPSDFPDNVHKLVIDSGNYTRVDKLQFYLACQGADADGDGHYTPDSICYSPKDDCDDSDPSVPSPEVCGDGVDNDCDGNVDCFDLDCSPSPVCSPPDCSSNVAD